MFLSISVYFGLLIDMAEMSPMSPSQS